LRRQLDLGLPPPRRLSRVALAFSAALHLVLFLTLSIEGRPLGAPIALGPRVQLVELPPYPMLRTAPLPEPTGPSAGGGATRLGRNAPPAAGHADTALFAPVPERVTNRAERTDTGAAESAVTGRIGPGIARGRLWVRPLPLPPRELARRLTRSHTELVDSAVTEVVQAFLDSIARDPASQGVRLPSWTTTVAGTKFGLDSKYLYIAGLRIPAAVLALLPIPSMGNELHAFDRSGEMYEDLRRAAQRSDNVAEFKDAIREIRERSEREREFQRNQRSDPDRTENELEAQ
jgi:hypothetical protein